MQRRIPSEFGRRMPQVFPAAASSQTEVTARRRLMWSLLVAGISIICLAGAFALLAG
ncbi:hypothetical protein [Pseudohoeflea suaedae]|uniref:hypothetical protein n=1 Tax=Pseudohoeflea suaedae TaxID=877384 RepID=UPI001304BD5B|nr:hypothetical protein [Pseudohoeflea suaedae]